MRVLRWLFLSALCGQLSVVAQDLAPETVENMGFQWIVDRSTPYVGGVRQFLVLAAGSAIYTGHISSLAYEAAPGRHRWTKRSADAGVLEFTDAQGRSSTQFELTFRAGSGDFGGSFLIPVNGQRGEFELMPFSTATGVPLRNGSVRAVAGEGRPARLGLVTGGVGTRRVLVRAIGPTLRSFGEAAPARDLTLRVLKRGALRASNAGWDPRDVSAREAMVEAFVLAGAFPLERGSGDCALLLNLEAGEFVAEADARVAGAVLIEFFVIE